MCAQACNPAAPAAAATQLWAATWLCRQTAVGPEPCPAHVSASPPAAALPFAWHRPAVPLHLPSGK